MRFVRCTELSHCAVSRSTERKRKEKAGKPCGLPASHSRCQALPAPHPHGQRRERRRHRQHDHRIPAQLREQCTALPVYLTYPHAQFYPSRLVRFVAMMREAIPPLVEGPDG